MFAYCYYNAGMIRKEWGAGSGIWKCRWGLFGALHVSRFTRPDVTHYSLLVTLWLDLEGYALGGLRGVVGVDVYAVVARGPGGGLAQGEACVVGAFLGVVLAQLIDEGAAGTVPAG